MEFNLKSNERLKQVRLALGFGTSKEFAEAININAGTYRSYENGSRDFPLDILLLLKRKYKVSMEWLTMGTCEMFAQSSVGDLLTKDEKDEYIPYIKAIRGNPQLKLIISKLTKDEILTAVLFRLLRDNENKDVFNIIELLKDKL